MEEQGETRLKRINNSERAVGRIGAKRESPHILSEASWEAWAQLALSEKQVFPISSCFSLCYENDQGLKESCVCWAAIWSTHPTSVGETAQEPSPVFMMGWLCRDKLSGSKQACQFTEKAANQLSLFCTTLSLEFYPKDMKTGD